MSFHFKFIYEQMSLQMVQIRRVLTAQSKKRLLIGSSATCVALLLIRQIYYKMKRKYYALPPGPVGIPVFGSMFSAINFPTYANYLYSRYGNTTMINIGSKRLVLLHSIDVIEEVFATKNVINRDYDNALHLPKGCKPFELNAVTISTKYWAHKRKIFQSILLSNLNSSFISDAHNYSLQTKIMDSIDDCIQSNQKWEPFHDIAYSQFNVIWFAAFGSALSFEDPEREKIMQYIEGVFNETGLDLFFRSVSIFGFRFPLPKWLQYSIFTQVEKFDAFLEAMIYKHCTDEDGRHYDPLVFDKQNDKWAEHFRKIANKNDANVISKLIANYRNSSSEESTKTSIIGDVAVLFEAGVETTMNTAEIALALLAKDEGLQDRLYEELFQVFGADWKMEKVQFSAVSNQLHLLRAFIYEASRLSAVVPLGVGHVDFERDIVVENARDASGNPCQYIVPKGVEFMANIPNANMNDAYWLNKAKGKRGPSAGIQVEFWLDEQGKFKPNLNKNKMLSFGVGQRDCAGKHLAIRSLSVIFTKWILLYKFKIDQDTPINKKFHFSISLDPKIPISVERR